ncbi:MAG TPA: hypothetical protein PK598_15975, partial [Thermoanaerobaculia bacterium]|nr:hypothetical protein [Thermoanaerobaculia bacterium]
MSRPPKSPGPPDDGVVYLESDGREDLARALAEAERAAAGQRPAGAAAVTVTASAKITKLDKAGSTITVVGPK